MNKLFTTIIIGSIYSIVCYSENIVIKSPGYFTEPIRDGYSLFPDSLVLEREAEEIVIPDMGMFGRLGAASPLPHFYFHNITMLPAVISKAPMMTFVLTGSFNRKKASSMVMTTLNLSIGATRETSPVCNALK